MFVFQQLKGFQQYFQAVAVHFLKTKAPGFVHKIRPSAVIMIISIVIYCYQDSDISKEALTL